MRLEDEEYSVESYQDERCANSQTDWQHHIDPVGLRGRIDKIGNNAWWRFQARPKEHGLCRRCHRLRCRIRTLRHGDCMGKIAALVL